MSKSLLKAAFSRGEYHCLVIHKTWLALFIILFVNASAYAQSSQSNHGISLSAFYGNEFVIDGYVRVREWEMQGDKMYLQELGLNNYPALQLKLEKRFRRHNSISISYERYFLNGSASFNRKVEYNGTIIEGSGGIDVSPTRYYRLSGQYRGNFYSGNNFFLQFLAGVVYDHATFYLDGEVASNSPRNEVYEQFGRQALPYPVLGISARYIIEDVNSLQLDVSGTYIPLFESFYVEGGNMYLQYSTFLSDLRYTRNVASFEFSFGAKFRSMHLFQESHEDTNDLKMEVASPYIGVTFIF